MLQLEICANVDATFGRAVLYRVGRGAALPSCTLHRDSATVAPLSLSLSLSQKLHAPSYLSIQSRRRRAEEKYSSITGRREKGKQKRLPSPVEDRRRGRNIWFFPFPARFETEQQSVTPSSRSPFLRYLHFLGSSLVPGLYYSGTPTPGSAFPLTHSPLFSAFRVCRI